MSATNDNKSLIDRTALHLREQVEHHRKRYKSSIRAVKEYTDMLTKLQNRRAELASDSNFTASGSTIEEEQPDDFGRDFTDVDWEEERLELQTNITVKSKDAATSWLRLQSAEEDLEVHMAGMREKSNQAGDTSNSLRLGSEPRND